ncbi:hypothetical protein HYU12_04595 [Candidatus Woesearchaeota archaeon]|nr:hypothetical protein [Candidatus Woesearchaeota archaeon]
MGMEVVLDANVLFRMLISQGNIIELLFNDNLKLMAPERLREEFLKHEEEIIEKSHRSKEEIGQLTELIFSRISLLPLTEYKALLPKAKEILGSHEKDEEFVAICLLKNVRLWTYEKLLFRIGVGISTKEVAGLLSGYS